MRLYLILLLLFFSFTVTNSAIADMDCGKESIGKGPGDNFDETYAMDKIRSICGSPTKIENWRDEVLINISMGMLKQLLVIPCGHITVEATHL